MNAHLDCGHEPSSHSEHPTGTADTADGREMKHLRQANTELLHALWRLLETFRVDRARIPSASISVVWETLRAVS